MISAASDILFQANVPNTDIANLIYCIYPYKCRAYITPGSKLMQWFSALNYINVYVKCRGLSVKNHIKELNARASIQINTVLLSRVYITMAQDLSLMQCN